jgi:hypothetical protein
MLHKTLAVQTISTALKERQKPAEDEPHPIDIGEICHASKPLDYY